MHFLTALVSIHSATNRGRDNALFWTFNSVVECYLHTVEVTGSNPVTSNKGHFNYVILRVMKGSLMGLLSEFRYRKISQTATVNDLLKEFFRKTIHICASLVPFLASWHYSLTITALCLVTLAYVYCEYNRMRGRPIPFVSRITAYASRRRDDGRFVLGPVTLSLGILFTLLLFPPSAARVGIFALAFGDGVASLAGKIYGRIKIPGARGKTLEGSSACLIAVYASTMAVTHNPVIALEAALFAMLIEVLPLKDYDNFFIPLAISSLVVLIG